MKKTGHFAKIVILVLIFSLCATPYIFGAGGNKSISDYEEDLEKAKGDKKDLESQLKDGKNQSNSLASEIKSLEKKIYASESEINDLEIQINDTKDRITETLGYLDDKKTEINKQNDDLNARLRAMYKSGEAGFLSVLLGSTSLSDLMTNIDMVKRIYSADSDLLAMLEGQYDEIEGIYEDLATMKEQLQTQQAEADAKKTALESDKTTLAGKKKEVDADNKELEAQIDALNKEADALTAKIKQLQSEAEYAGGVMCWPAAASTRVTSNFGYRKHPILKTNKLHTGIDIGAAGGTNILAANSGKVISAGYNSGYGYMVMIDHGGGIVTLYAHSSKLLVKTGDQVKRGQVIALVGSTGMSTGNHLHFEIRINGTYVDPLTKRDGGKYVSPNVRK